MGNRNFDTEEFEKLREEIKNCRECPLCETRKNVVFGDGNPNAHILLIGEAPGEDEDNSGIPFVGRSGRLLTEMMSDVRLTREKDYFIINMLKCRPPKNRDPLPQEMACCSNHLFRQIECINPDIIVCVGRIAATQLIKKDFKVTKEHGTFYKKDDGRIYMGTFHPAAILRNINQKPLAMADLENLKKLTDLLDKQ